jgi:hypothetical protein
MTEPRRSIAQLDALFAGARRLGFLDEVAHWTAERAAALDPEETKS